jgi:hypothetical protein
MRIFEKQTSHLISLMLLLSGVFVIARGDFLSGAFFGISTKTWLWMSILIPILHQTYVFVLWRAELHYQLLSSTFNNIAFVVWGVGFTILFVSRFISVVGLSIANRDTLILPEWLVISLSSTFFLLVAYLAYSVLRYFGIKRAMGMDHFQPEVYRNLTFVKQGIFRWSSNAMYMFGFLILWIPGLILGSKSGLLSALFNHLYIWVHYFFTEYPDMKVIYPDN